MNADLYDSAADPSRKRLLRVSEVATILGLSKSRVYELCRRNILPAVRIGRQVRVDHQEIEEFIRSGGKGLPDECWTEITGGAE